MQVPLLDLKLQFKTLKAEVMKAIEELCDTQLFILGKKVEDFETSIAQYCQCKYAIGVTSGSDALLASMMTEGIGIGDEVITTPFSFFATAGAIARIGAKPVFVDINEADFNINADLIESKITNKTRAIIPVHLFGQMAEMDKIIDISRKHNLIVIEDGAQAIGSEYLKCKAGSFGDYGCFSFFPSKNLGGFGDGGIITTNCKDKSDLLKSFRNHGADSNNKYIYNHIGGNFRLDAIQAAVLQVKLKYLDSWHLARQKNADEYRTLFARSSISGKIILPEIAGNATKHIYNQFCIRVKNGKRDLLKAGLNKVGIGSDIYYPVPLHLQKCFAYLGYRKSDFPVSETIAAEILALPVYPETTFEQRQYVVSKTEEILSE
ncbi:MAG TPA: transcriptional regulator [Lentisphaeria bacterium]|nr:MAG: transcriptional regulator [Lentisphaerae bacterium GWF2_38_69]HBM17518.1 transcriptional regulator [Lentisphaeria bacterium]